MAISAATCRGRQARSTRRAAADVPRRFCNRCRRARAAHARHRRCPCACLNEGWRCARARPDDRHRVWVRIRPGASQLLSTLDTSAAKPLRASAVAWYVSAVQSGARIVAMRGRCIARKRSARPLWCHPTVCRRRRCCGTKRPSHPCPCSIELELCRVPKSCGPSTLRPCRLSFACS